MRNINHKTGPNKWSVSLSFKNVNNGVSKVKEFTISMSGSLLDFIIGLIMAILRCVSLLHLWCKKKAAIGRLFLFLLQGLNCLPQPTAHAKVKAPWSVLDRWAKWVHCARFALIDSLIPHYRGSIFFEMAEKFYLEIEKKIADKVSSSHSSSFATRMF